MHLIAPNMPLQILKALEGDERRLMAARLDEIHALNKLLLDNFDRLQNQNTATVDAIRALAERTTTGAGPLALDALRALAEHTRAAAAEAGELTYAPVSVTYATGQTEPFLSATSIVARSKPEK